MTVVRSCSDRVTSRQLELRLRVRLPLFSTWEYSSHLLTYFKSSNHITDINLLVSTFEVSSVMATSFNPKSHINITLQHPITCIHFLCGWLPSQYLLLHDWAISGKVHTLKTDVIDKTFVSGPTCRKKQKTKKEVLVINQCNQTFKENPLQLFRHRRHPKGINDKRGINLQPIRDWVVR